MTDDEFMEQRIFNKKKNFEFRYYYFLLFEIQISEVWMKRCVGGRVNKLVMAISRCSKIFPIFITASTEKLRFLKKNIFQYFLDL